MEVQATHWLLKTRASRVPLPHPASAVPAEPLGLWASYCPVQFSHAQPVQDGPRARARWGRGSHLGPLAGTNDVRPYVHEVSRRGPSSFIHAVGRFMLTFAHGLTMGACTFSLATPQSFFCMIFALFRRLSFFLLACGCCRLWLEGQAHHRSLLW